MNAERNGRPAIVNPPALSERRWLAVMPITCAMALALSVHAQTAGRAGAADLLQFLDGSTLHGTLETIGAGRSVQWRHPASRATIAFQPRNLHRLRFMSPAPAMPPQDDTPACRLRFANGDEVVGDVLSLDDREVVFKTWFGGELRAPRSSIQTLRFIKNRSIVAYEGPGGLAEWNLGQPGGVWSYRDGVLTANAIGSIGRDVGLPPQGRIEFDLSWTGQLSLLMSIYTESTARFDFNSSGYMFILGPGYVTLQRMQGIRGTTHMGQAAAPQLIEKNEAHFEIRADKEQGSITLMIDGATVQQWTDGLGFAGQGTGMTFLCQRVGPELNLSNIRVSSWEGNAPPETVRQQEETQAAVSLMNGDVARGDVTGIKDGRLELKVNGKTLPVPLDRVSLVMFPDAVAGHAAMAGLVRAELHSGASVTFEIRDWKRDAVTGVSPHFGPVTLKPEWIRQLVFNPDKPRPDRLPAAGKDDLFWPFAP